jgi:hypothetical protein
MIGIGICACLPYFSAEVLCLDMSIQQGIMGAIMISKAPRTARGCWFHFVLLDSGIRGVIPFDDCGPANGVHLFVSL